MQVVYDSDTPPYRQLANGLRERILAGELPPKSRLPSIVTLQQESGVARLTARKALAVLVNEGYARREPGWGTFVADRSEWPAT